MKPSPAQRVAGTGVSIIRTLSEGAPAGSIALGLGEPSWPMPQIATEALAKVSGVLGYGPQAGLLELRQAIGARHEATPDEVLVTNGTQEGLFDVFQAYLDPGDAVLVPDPGFVGYPGVARLAGAEVVPYRLAADRGFALDPAAVRSALDATPRAKLLILNHPSNPTGGGATRAALAEVCEAARARDVLVVSDEVYRELHFGDPVPSVREVARDALVLDSCSKGFSGPGLRIGWAVGPTEVLGPLKVVHGYAVTGASVPAQRAATALIEARAGVLPAVRGELQRRYDALATAVKAHMGRTIQPPAGSFYHFLPLPEEAWGDPVEYCTRLRDEARVVLIPGLVFGEAGRRFARLSFAAPPDQVAEGVRRIAAFWQG